MTQPPLQVEVTNPPLSIRKLAELVFMVGGQALTIQPEQLEGIAAIVTIAERCTAITSYAGNATILLPVLFSRSEENYYEVIGHRLFSASQAIIVRATINPGAEVAVITVTGIPFGGV